MAHVAAQHAAAGVGAVHIHILEAYVAHVTAEHTEDTGIGIARGSGAGEVADYMSLSVKVDPVHPSLVLGYVRCIVEANPVAHAAHVDIVCQLDIGGLARVHLVVQVNKLLGSGNLVGIVLGALMFYGALGMFFFSGEECLCLLVKQCSLRAIDGLVVDACYGNVALERSTGLTIAVGVAADAKPLLRNIRLTIVATAVGRTGKLAVHIDQERTAFLVPDSNDMGPFAHLGSRSREGIIVAAANVGLEGPLVIVNQHSHATALFVAQHAAPGVGIIFVGPVGTCEEFHRHAVGDSLGQCLGHHHTEVVCRCSAPCGLCVAEDIHVERLAVQHFGSADGDYLVVGG